MCCNRRTLVAGLVVLLPAIAVVAYLVVPRASQRDVYRQTVTPATAAFVPTVDKPDTKPTPTANAVKAAIARSLGTPPVLNVIEEKREDRTSKALLQAEPPLLAAEVRGANPVPALPPVANSGVPMPPEIRTVSATAPSPAPLSGPSPPIRIVDTPPPPGVSPKPAHTEVKCPWTLHLEVVKGRTILTAKGGKDARFRVDCDLLELKAPQGSIQASGNVKISSDALEGNSDRLTLNLQEDQVVLEGRAALLARGQDQNMEIKGERLSLRLVVKTGAGIREKIRVSK